MSNESPNNNDTSKELATPQSSSINKKTYNVKPSLLQKKSMKNLVEKGGSVSRAMREAGYSPATAHNPRKLTQAKGWQQLVEQYLPDRLLLRTNKALLRAKRITRTFIKGNMTQEIVEEDTYARANGLKLALQVKGRLVNKTELKGKLSLTSLVEEHG